MRQWMIAAAAVTGLTLTMGAQGVAHAQERSNRSSRAEHSMGEALGTGRAGDQRPIEQKQSEFQNYGDAPSVVTLPTPGWGADAQGLGGSGTGGSGMLRTDTVQEQGIIRSVSDKGMTISIPKKDRIVTLRVDDQAQLLRDDQPLALSSLQVGDEVRATYQFNEDGDKVLRGLEVTKERAAQAKKK